MTLSVPRPQRHAEERASAEHVRSRRPGQSPDPPRRVFTRGIINGLPLPPWGGCVSWNLVTSMPVELAALLLIYWVGVAIAVVTDDRDPTATLAWLLVLFALPIVGLAFYFFFGRNWKKIAQRSARTRALRERALPTMTRVYERYTYATDEAMAWAQPLGMTPVLHTIMEGDSAPPLPAYDIEILINGAAKFAALKRDLAAAADTIDIMYFIWEKDALTAELTAILLDRLSAGVEVRMLNDLFGCLPYKKDEMKRLRAAGARVLYDVTDLRKLNYRNHRKIVVIDGVVGYTGGINVGQEYIDGKPHYASWRDTHCKFHGPAVADLQKLFAIRWMDRTGEDIFNERFFPAEYPEDGRRTLVQTVSQGVEMEWDPGRRAHEVGIASAEDRVWIQSPYFIPTPAIYQIMINQALAGRDVRLMMTGIADKVLAWRAAETFFLPLIEAGGKVYRYDAGFFHAKTMTIDGEALVVGTMNMDIRSLALHKELMVWIYDQDLAREHEAVFLDDMTRCEEITLETIEGWSAAHHLRNALSRLMSNLM